MTTPKQELGNRWLGQALGLSSEQSPFPWQRRLLQRFVAGKIDRALDLPTGLGKTAVMAIWAVARGLGAALPRRLVYVVDRRAVVDQATAEAERIREWVRQTPEAAERMGAPGGRLPISTLRGQFVDNREWLDDPSAAAIIVGTVDMVGSRLLFEGYGVSRKMRPYQAGLLGSDTLFILDESHLVPPFEHLIDAIAHGADEYGPANTEGGAKIPGVRLLSLSATGRDHGDRTFHLDEADFAEPVVAQRLRASKRLEIAKPVAAKELPEALAECAWRLAEASDAPIRCIVFVSRRTDAEKTKREIETRAMRSRDKKAALPTVELFVGARRVRERQVAAERLQALGFLAGARQEKTDHAFVIATSAGEVGVDLDADHMVSDLVAWERMVQRLGRVNRRGGGDAQVHVIPSDEAPPDVDVKAVAKLLAMLPQMPDGGRDASPVGLTAVLSSPDAEELLTVATTPAPLHPQLNRPLVESWAMTSLRDHPGRPQVGPWLRGWIPVRPQTGLVWRHHLSSVAENAEPGSSGLSELLDAAPPHMTERLEAETAGVVDWLQGCVTRLYKKADKQELGLLRKRPVAVVLGRANELTKVLVVDDLETKGEPKKKRALLRWLADNTLVVDAALAGLSIDGLLDATVAEAPSTADAAPGWGAEGLPGEPPAVRFRFREETGDVRSRVEGPWRERHRVALERSAEGEVIRWLVIDKWRNDSETEDDRSTASVPQALEEHQSCAEAKAKLLAERMGLSDQLAEMLAIAARLHDEGKRAQRWQRAFHAPRDGVTYAKTKGPVNVKLLGGYRHEFGSLAYAERSERLRTLPEHLRELALHLIASHHGHARPLIRVDGCDDAPPSVLEARARATAVRYVELQARWGPWGLAFWEALLRAADQQASRENDQSGGVG